MEEENINTKCETQVLSDVHVHLPCQSVRINDGVYSVSKFFFKTPCSLIHAREESNEQTSTDQPYHGKELVADEIPNVCQYDKDGDLIVTRKPAKKDSADPFIAIVHSMATELCLVGQQVWLGALLLCDFMLHYNTLFHGKVIIDLGAGVGLTSIVAAFHAETVYCTDNGHNILNLAKVNAERNSLMHQTGRILVRKLDWTAEAPFMAHSGSSGEMDSFSLSDEDLKTLQSCCTILAAEVVYDDDLTDAFFCMLYKLLLKPPAKTVYMTVEKRQVFTIADRDVVSPAYTHFIENLQDLCSIDEGPVRFLCAQIDTSFPKNFCYQRSKELELWKIETVFMHSTQFCSSS